MQEIFPRSCQRQIKSLAVYTLPEMHNLASRESFKSSSLEFCCTGTAVVVVVVLSLLEPLVEFRKTSLSSLLRFANGGEVTGN